MREVLVHECRRWSSTSCQWQPRTSPITTRWCYHLTSGAGERPDRDPVPCQPRHRAMETLVTGHVDLEVEVLVSSTATSQSGTGSSSPRARSVLVRGDPGEGRLPANNHASKSSSYVAPARW